LLERAELAAADGDYRAAFEIHRRYHDAHRLLQDERREARARVVLALYANREALLARDQFRELANRDPLTGLHNRRHCDDLLAELTPAATPASPLSAALIDIDFFKRINDECSHETGDAVLRELAGILLASCPAPAEVARLGGEEFVLVFPGVDATHAWVRCEQVRIAIADHDWRPLTGGRPITVSIGVTTAQERTTAAKLLADADRNLYAAKRTGRDRVVED
jgi:two-component system cell cycle response regulator